MKILPAIDIKDAQAVRLYQGDFSQQEVVNDSPIEQAKLFSTSGLTYLHIVDLDGALEGTAVNAKLIEQLKAVSQMKVEVGGGIRTFEQIETYLNQGVDRVIIGSMAVQAPGFVKQALHTFGPEKIVVGIDAKKGYVSTNGWLEKSEVTYLELAQQMADIGVELFVYTDIDRDGTLTGPNFSHYQQLVDLLPNCQIIASGGVQSVNDLWELEKIGVSGAIVGKAYYSGHVSLDEMVQVEQRSLTE